MKKLNMLFVVISSLCFLCTITNAQAPDWLWAKSAWGTSSATSIALDGSGNICVAGYFDSPTIIFDSTILTNAGSTNLFLTKYDGNGNVLWAKSTGDPSSNGLSVTVDTLLNIYLTGCFISQTITFGTTTLINFDNTGNTADLFFVKYDSSGNVLWAKSTGGSNSDVATSVKVDASGNSYIAGWFKSPTLTFDSTTLTNVINTSSSYDLFLSKYDSGGNVIWAKSMGGINFDYAQSIAVDASGNIYLSGIFSSPTITFDSTTLTNAYASAGAHDIFLAKYNSSGNVLWAKSAGENVYNNYANVMSSVEVDVSGNTYMAGCFYSPITLGSSTFTNIGTTGNTADIFLAKYDSIGNVLWAKSEGGTSWDEVNSIAVDTSLNIYVAGWFMSPTISFDSTILTNAHTSGYYDLFLAKIGQCNITPPLITQIENFLTSTNASTYQWYLNGDLIIGATSGIYIPVQNGSYTVAITDRLGCFATSGTYEYFLVNISEIKNADSFFIYPNPTNNKFSLKVLPKTEQIQIINSFGQIMKSIILDGQTTMDFEIETSGIYFIQIITDKQIITKKIIVCK